MPMSCGSNELWPGTCCTREYSTTAHLQVRAALCSGLSSGPRNDAPDAALAMRQRWRLAELRAEEYAFVLLSQFTSAIEAQVRTGLISKQPATRKSEFVRQTAAMAVYLGESNNHNIDRGVLPSWRAVQTERGRCQLGQRCWACATWAWAAGSSRSAWQWRMSYQHGSAWASSAAVTTPSGADAQEPAKFAATLTYTTN